MPNSSKKRDSKKKTMPAQSQRRQPGREYKMVPQPVVIRKNYAGSGKLLDRAALITGGDSGIGRSVAVHFAREGADVAIVYLEEEKDADETRRQVEAHGSRCLMIRGDVGDRSFCQDAVSQTIKAFGRLDILVNNAAEQHEASDLLDIDEKQLLHTFRTNIFSYFFMTQAALPHLKKQTGASIINTTSVTAYRGSPHLVDYSTTKGAIVSFTRSLSGQLAEAGPEGSAIRVNAVAPGPIWTPLIPASFKRDKVAKFGGDTPMRRPGQPAEVGPSFVFLASEDASYITGQVLHPNGGEIVNS